LQSEALAPDEAAAAALKAKLESLSIKTSPTPTTSVREKLFSDRVYKLEENDQSVETFSVHFEEDQAALAYSTSHGDYTLPLGRDRWLTDNIRENGVIDLHKYSSLIFSSFTWRDEDTLELIIRYVETTFNLIIICRFEGDEIILEQKKNVSFFPNVPTFTRGRS
jgi:hypothetical protein